MIPYREDNCKVWPVGVVEWHFHWKFWKPYKCVGGPIRFGYWAQCEHETKGEYYVTEQSLQQVKEKISMGLL